MPGKRKTHMLELLSGPRALSYREILAETGLSRESSVATVIKRLREDGEHVAQGLVLRDGRLVVVFHRDEHVIRKEAAWTRADVPGLIDFMKRTPLTVSRMAAFFHATEAEVRGMIMSARNHLARDPCWCMKAERMTKNGEGRMRQYSVVQRKKPLRGSRLMAAE